MSHEIKMDQYFEVLPAQIKLDQVLPCPVCIYLKANDHLVRWKNTGDLPNQEQLEKLRAAKITTLYVSVPDRLAWETYLAPPVEAPKTNLSVSDQPITLATPIPKSVSAQAKALTQAIGNQKAEIIAPIAQNSLSQGLAATTPDAQERATRAQRQLIQDVLSELTSSSAQMASQLFSAAETNPDLSHGLNVATYATLLALAFGKIKPEVISDLALAGLLHDIGLTQIPLSIISGVSAGSEKVGTGSQNNLAYRKHVLHSVSLVKEYIPDVSPRCLTLITQHHEKFDGSGYPQKLQAFQFDDIAQLLAMANILDEFTTGQFSGTPQTAKEALTQMENIERSRNFPEYFNPEVFSAVLKWMRKETNQELLLKTKTTVNAQTEKLVRPKAS